MHDGRDMLEKPLMRAIVKVEHMFHFSSPKFTPASRYDSSHAKGLNCMEKEMCQSLRIIDDNAAKTNIDQFLSGIACRSDELNKIIGWCPFLSTNISIVEDPIPCVNIKLKDKKVRRPQTCDTNPFRPV